MDLPDFDRLLWLVFQHNDEELRCYGATNQHQILGIQTTLDWLQKDNDCMPLNQIKH